METEQEVISIQGLPAVWASRPPLGCGSNALQSASTKFYMHHLISLI